jgi:hypothetical protein
MKKRHSGVIGVLACMIPLLAASAAPAAYELPSSVLTGAGGAASSASYRLVGSLGQPTPPGGGSGAVFTTEAGFWNTATVDPVGAPMVTAFVIPSSHVSQTVPITIFTASDNVRVARYLVNESETTPSLSDPNWSAAAPTQYDFASPGAKTLYAWARDDANNISAGSPAGVTISPAEWLLTVATAGTGAGVVNSDSGGIACVSGSDADCSASYVNNASVTLAATPDWKSAFGAWSGAMTGITNPEAVTMNADKTVTATFSVVNRVRRTQGTDTDYPAIQAACNAVTAAAAIKAQTFSYPEQLLFNRPHTVTFNGGMDGAYANYTGYTTVQSLTVTQGTVIVNRFVIR